MMCCLWGEVRSMSTRFNSIDDIPRIPVQEFFSEHPDPTGYFRSYSPIGSIGSIGSGFEFENDPLPLSERTTPPFPKGALPSDLGKSSEAVAKHIQVPRAFSCASHLAAV